MFTQKQIENISVTPLYYIGYGRIILFFIINCFLLYSVANALAGLNGILTGRVYGSLILGSLFGISFPIIMAKNKGDQSFQSVLRKLVNIGGIIIIQGFVLSDTLYLFSQGVENEGDLKYAIFNIVVGVIADLAVGSEFSSHVKEQQDDELQRQQQFYKQQRQQEQLLQEQQQQQQQQQQEPGGC